MFKKMSTVFISMFLLTVFIFPPNSTAEQSENNEFPRAYRSIYFGDSREIVDRKIEEDDFISSNGFVMLADEVELFLYFGFWEDKLHSFGLGKSVYFLFDSPMDQEFKNLQRFLVDLIKEKYGPPSRVSGPTWDQRYYWSPEDLDENKRINIFTYSVDDHEYYSGVTPMLQILYPPLIQKMETAEKEKARKEREELQEKKKEAAQDF